MDTEDVRVKFLKQDCLTIQESLYSLSAIIKRVVDVIIFTDIEPKSFGLLLDVQHDITLCRKKMNMASKDINKISDIIE